MRQVKFRYRCFLVALSVILVIYILINSSGPQTPEYPQQDTEKSHLERDYVLQQNPEAVQQKTNDITHMPGKSAVKPNIFVNTDPLKGAKRASLKTFHGKIPMFVYPPEIDNMISSRIWDYGTWEEDLLNATSQVFLKSKDIVFLDVGCNIGVYTLYMAKLGALVVAVEPVTDNLKLLSTSLKVGNLAENVTLVNNAISDSRRNASVVIPDKNIGGAYLSDDGMEAKSQSVQTIVLDDIASFFKGHKVFMKMDIEGHEYNAISSGHDFFQTVDVTGILMEWVHHRYKDTGEKIIKVLISNGMLPYEDVNKDKMLHPDRSHRWPENIFWMKR